MRKSMLFAAAGLALVSVASGVRASGGGEGGGELNLVPMDEIRVPIIEGDRADGTLRLKLVLVTHDAAAAEHVTATLPALRAASLGAAIEFARLYASPMMPVDAGRLDADLTAALHSQDAGIARVLIVEVSARQA